MKQTSPLKYILLLTIIFTGIHLHGQSISGIINSYYKVTGINTLTNGLTLSSTGGLTPGSKILIIQMKGANITSTNTAAFGNITAINNTGNYEINEVCAVSGSDILLKYQLLRTYDPSGFVQIVTVPVYSSVTIVDTLKAPNWDPATGTGGVLVMEASGTVTMNSPIDVSGKGFTGGSLRNYAGCVWSTNVTQYSLAVTPADPNTNGAKKGEGIADFILNNEYARGKQANGGGGGNNHNTGGGGGSHIGTGGQGGVRSGETFFQCHGASPGVGGVGIQSFGYTVANNRIFMGGGGGAGHQNNGVGTPGGNGGGIVLIKANTIAGAAAKFLANGAEPFNPACANPLVAEGDGAGGGGAGGTILLDVQNYSGSFIAEAKGADGSVSGNLTNSCVGPGGGGGGGIVWVSAGSFPGNISTVLTGGSAGFISLSNSGGCAGQNNGATAGTGGTTITGFTIPFANTFICAPLAGKYLKSFSGEHMASTNILNWSIREIERSKVKQINIEKSIDAIRFERIAQVGSSVKSWVDKNAANGIQYYRLKMVDIDGKIEYSKTISIDARIKQKSPIQYLYPNPVSDVCFILITSKESRIVPIRLFNQFGQLINTNTWSLKTGDNTVQYDFSNYPSGLYFLSIELDGQRFVNKIVVQR